MTSHGPNVIYDASNALETATVPNMPISASKNAHKKPPRKPLIRYQAANSHSSTYATRENRMRSVTSSPAAQLRAYPSNDVQHDPEDEVSLQNDPRSTPELLTDDESLHTEKGD